jgi:hypothetical protein
VPRRAEDLECHACLLFCSGSGLLRTLSLIARALET